MIVKKIYKFILNVIKLIELGDYKSLWRKLTFQYRLYNFKQDKKNYEKLIILKRYKKFLADGVNISLDNYEVNNFLKRLCIPVNENAKIIITDSLLGINTKKIDRLVIFIEFNQSDQAASCLNNQYIDYLLTPFLNKYDVCVTERVFLLDINNICFSLGRLLLAIDIINFEQFMQYCDEINPFAETNAVCLSLPEYHSRYKYICTLINSDKLSCTNFRIAVGLRHLIGWVGCGLSYKYLFTKALQNKLSNITIAEDDILPKVNFTNNYKKIQKYLKSNMSWEVFNGYTFIGKEIKLSYLTSFGDNNLYLTSSFLSTVFNIYNHNAIEIGSKWNPYLRNKEKNTIDLFLKHSLNNIIVSYPFIIEHNEKLESVIWGNSNEFIYSHMTAESNQIAKDTINIK